jgi:hypothetical protein
MACTEKPSQLSQENMKEKNENLQDSCNLRFKILKFKSKV